jgi:hypothetical protein
MNAVVATSYTPNRNDVWRGRHRLGTSIATLATGHAELDAALPGGGWPVGALIEVLAAPPGIGELRLFFPALAQLAALGRRILVVAPPHPLHAPALAEAGIAPARVLVLNPGNTEDALWSAEQGLSSGALGATLCWIERGDERALRRLQLAAERGAMLALVFRPPEAAREFSPAALRLRLDPERDGGTRVEILKCRGALGYRHTLRLAAVA